MFLLLLLLNLASAQFLPLPIGQLFGNETLPSNLTGLRFIVVGGTKGIGNATATLLWQRGATVTGTTRNLITANSSAYPFELMELHYGKEGSVDAFFHNYIHKYGTVPDGIYDIGLQAFNGNELDFSQECREYAMRMYYTDPIYLFTLFLQQYNLTYNATSTTKTFNISIALSNAAVVGAAPVFLLDYSIGKFGKWSFIQNWYAYYGYKYYPNVRFTGIACNVVNTTQALTVYNPSALKGDAVNIEFDNYVAALSYSAGNSPDQIATAHIYAMTQLDFTDNYIWTVYPFPDYVEAVEFAYYIQVNTTGPVYTTYVREYYAGAGIILGPLKK